MLKIYYQKLQLYSNILTINIYFSIIFFLFIAKNLYVNKEMSAGGISYSGLVNHGKVTLPSVDTWGVNNNILRDPPKSYYTRRIDKVGQTSSITEMIDDSGNRACEAIQVFARGVNPMVSVSYNNFGNNGGQTNGTLDVGQRSAKLPYTIMRDGAFRPPVLLQQDLLPLSRMPRNWTNAFSQPGFVDFSRKLRTCGTSENTKEVKTETLKACIRPSAVYQIEKPIEEPFEIKYLIQPVLKTTANSGIRTMDITQKHVGNPTKEIDRNPLHANAQSNASDNRNYIDNSQMETERYIQHTNPHPVVSNISSNLHHTSIEYILDLSDLPVYEKILKSSVDAPVNGPEQTKYFHDDIDLSRNLPYYNANTNFGNTRINKNIQHENTISMQRNIPMGNFVSNPVIKGSSDHGSRTAYLNPKINPGGYAIPAQIPTSQRHQSHNQSSGDSEKAKMNKMVMESMQGRFDKPSPFSFDKPVQYGYNNPGQYGMVY